jgi:hypothetical protein
MTTPTSLASDGEAALRKRLRAMSDEGLATMRAAAEDVVERLQRMTARGLNPATAALDGAEICEEWRHYPEGDATDAATGARYFFHVHEADERPGGEYGHFHVFAEAPGGAPDAAPTHLIAIALDASGGVLRLFTTNQWVTGETWREAKETRALLHGFAMRPGASPDRDGWIVAMLRLFRPQIEDLIDARDAALERLRRERPGEDLFACRDVRILSERPVSLLAQLRAVEDAARAMGTKSSTRRRPA